MYKSEKAMYPDVRIWLTRSLKSKHMQADVASFITEQKRLSRFLEDKGFHKYFPEYQAFDIKVDVLGVVKGAEKMDLAFVECKLKKITLRDISQLLGYSKVALPRYSLIISPAGISSHVDTLFNVLRRYDVLEYTGGRSILIGTWSEERREVVPPSIIPKGRHL